MNLSLKHFITTVLFLISTVTFSNLDYNNNIKEIHSSIMNLDFQKSDSLIHIETINNPQNSYISYFKTYRFFLQTYFNTTNNNYDNFFISSEHSLEILDNEDNKETALILLATLSIQQAFIHFLWGEHMSYVRSLMQGQSYIDNINSKSQNTEYLKIRSIYEVIGGSVPNKFKSVAKWFNIKGSPQKGLSLIDNYLLNNKQSSANNTEGQIIKLYLKHFLDVSESNNIENNNLLYQYVFLITSHISNKDKLGMIKKLESNHKLPSYFNFLKGKFLLELLNKEGLVIMDNYIRNHQSNSLIQSAHFYKAWYYCSQNENDLLRKEIEKTKNINSPNFPMDKKSLERVEQFDQWNPLLIKSRMLFDAGEYKQALSCIKRGGIQKELISKSDKIEYLYRLARIYEKLKNINKALNLYQIVINTNEDELYFVAYSAYCSGKIYYLRRQQKLALDFFAKALELNNGEYKTSIEKKCTFAIENISFSN